MADVAVAGVDGCPGGWVAALVQTASGRPADVRLVVAAGVVEILALDATAVCIDIPIGLPDAGPRRCDLEARRLLGPRRSSVFPAPVRAVLGAASYQEACARSVAASGRKLSLQAWHLVPRIADVDHNITPTNDRVAECHPELAFRLLAGRDLPPKRTAAGHVERIAALSTWYADAAAVVAAAPAPARRDDAADALVCAWSAWRRVTGRALTVPATPERDTTGLPMRIVA